MFDCQFSHDLGKESGLDNDSVCPLLGHITEGRIDIFSPTDHRRGDFDAANAASKLDLLQKGLRERIVWVGKNAHTAN